MDVDRLRAETRAEHEAVEALLPLTEPGLTRDLYRDVLLCMHRVVSAWETWASAHAPAKYAGMVQQRQRTPLIEADLRYLGVDTEPTHRSSAESGTASPFFDSLERSAAPEAAFLGAMYVMEGSTLGGQYIARHVEETLGLTAGEGDAYFRGYGENTGAMWKAFKTELGELPEKHTAEVIAAAKGMFVHFGNALRACPAAEMLRGENV